MIINVNFEKEEIKPDDGQSLEMICSRYHSISCYDIRVDGHHKSIAVADIGIQTHGDVEGDYFAIFEKVQTLYSDLYFEISRMEFMSADFLSDKDLVLREVVGFYKFFYKDSEINGEYFDE